MGLFNVFLPLSNDQFLKGDFFDSFNGLGERHKKSKQAMHFSQEMKANQFVLC
jgi:hypothetical protein